jgi:hypothetical protein
VEGATSVGRADRQLTLLEHLRTAVRREQQWSELFEEVVAGNGPPVGLHLAILVEPYLQFVLDRSKTVESRFSRKRSAPFGKVSPGDVVLLKRSSGPLVGSCTVTAVWDYRLTPTSWSEIKQRFGPAICPQGPFWEDRREASFATLMQITEARALPQLVLPKRDRRGWVVLMDQRAPKLL